MSPRSRRWAVAGGVVAALVCAGQVADLTGLTGPARPVSTFTVGPATRPAAATPPPTPATSRSRPPKPKPTATRTRRAPRNDPRYRTCAEANRHGYGPYLRGVDPEYRWYIDRDGDGLVCER